jgi:hypothetical protein
MHSASVQPPAGSTPIGTPSAITVLLPNDQIARLDEFLAAVRRRSGKRISRSGVLRAMAAALLPHHEDWIKVKSEEQLQQQIELRLYINTSQKEQGNA